MESLARPQHDDFTLWTPQPARAYHNAQSRRYLEHGFDGLNAECPDELVLQIR